MHVLHEEICLTTIIITNKSSQRLMNFFINNYLWRINGMCFSGAQNEETRGTRDAHVHDLHPRGRERAKRTVILLISTKSLLNDFT